MMKRGRGRPPKKKVEESYQIIDVQALSPKPPSKPIIRLKQPFDEHTFGDLLTKEEADRTFGTPSSKDLKFFEQSLTATRIEQFLEPPSGKRRKRQDPSNPKHEILHFGPYELFPWYSAPFPAEYFEGSTPGHLWMCESCLKYMRAKCTFDRHRLKCRNKVPPGNEIYRKDNLSVFEVNGRFSKSYCQRLCLLAKMFLDHKTLYYDVETFLFYVLIEWKPTELNDDREGDDKSLKGTFMSYSFVGYFSKEKSSPSDYNLSCIMTLPNHQRKGFGAFLMDFSYLLSRRSDKLGTPEKPLSDLGLLGYVKYWTNVVLDWIVEAVNRNVDRISVLDICKDTGMILNDVLATLEHLSAIVVDDNGGGDGGYSIIIKKELLDSHRSKQPSLNLRADPNYLYWVPYTCLR